MYIPAVPSKSLEELIISKLIIIKQVISMSIILSWG